ncbi:MAG: hypothetical protein K9I68_10485 [Bacteroidales bacterium]|nr:hypothetical protein [Bacteroidales bacterium]MCF8338437.1 hypothetical protein [Bacteroidales bacterium]
MIASDNTSQLIESLRQTYDYIILDTPPVGLVTDSQLIVKHVDIQLYIARQNFTDKNKFSEAINAILETQPYENAYVVLNDVISEVSEGHGYYSDDLEEQKKRFWSRLYHQ